MNFQTLPIRRKLMAIILGTSGVVVLLTCAAFLAYEFLTFRQGAARQLSTLGEVIATNSTAVLAFDNPKDAREVLGALRAERHIVAACLYDKNGRLFATYPDASPVGDFPARPGTDGFQFEAGSLSGFVPVVQVKGSARLGTLYLRSDLEAMHDRLRLYGGIALLAIALSSLVAYGLSRKLQQQISRPILALADTARAVSDRKDYSVRVERRAADEIGLLTDAFNHMLEQIEQQNRALQQAYDDLRQTQAAILQQERLRALGQLASGIAHDINNAISPASLYVESVLEKETGLSERSRERLITVQRAIDDVAQTVGRLRESYRPREPELALVPVNVNRMVEQVVELTRARWGDLSQQHGIAIDVRRELAAGLAPILGVEGELRDALTNLVFNAVDALPAGGAITVRTRRDDAPGGDGRNGLCIEVTDTGVGMDEETQRRCLEPFFTTKGERGTGLGLAMVHGAVRRHGGEMTVESAPGRGTTVRLWFPLPEAPLPLPPGASTSPFPAARRLLVVDDDPVLLQSLGETLAGDGHAVTTAGGGQAGIAAFHAARAEGRPFAAVITDLGMPGVDGREVARAIKTVSPGTPIFLLTGWAPQTAGGPETAAEFAAILRKPPRLAKLREVLASVPVSPP